MSSIVTILVGWCAVSVPVSLLVANFFARSFEETPEIVYLHDTQFVAVSVDKR